MIKKFLIKHVLPVFIVLSLVQPAWAENFKEFLPDLLKNHDLIRSYKERHVAAGFLLRQSRAGYYPSIDLTANGGTEDIDKEGLPETYHERHYAGLRATQLITDFGLTSGTIEKSRILSERAGRELASVQQQVILEGVTAYLNLVRARDKLKYAFESEANIKKQTGMEETLVEKGAGLTSDVLQAKYQLAGAMALRIRAEGDLALAKNRFNAVFKQLVTDDRINGLQPLLLPENRFPETMETAIERAMDKNAISALSKLDVEMARKEVRIRKSTRYPKFNLYAEAKHRDDDAGVRGYKNDSLLGLELTYNLFRGGGDRAALLAARADLSAAASQLQSTRCFIEEQVRNAWQNLSTNRSNARLLKEQTDIVGEFLKMARKERKLGTRSLLDVLTGETTFINSISNAISAETDTVIAGYNLLYAMGELEPASF